MSDYSISKVYSNDKRANSQIDELLIQEGIRRDGHLDYTCAMYDNDYNVIATGSCFGNTLRCMAVSSKHQGEGLMNEIVSHLMDFQYSRRNAHIFLYTKCNSAKFFSSLGFYEIKKIDDQLVFMENKRTGFKDYLSNLEKESCTHTTSSANASSVAAVVMNANPFTKGHAFLVEQICNNNDIVHLFMVSEDVSLIPFSVRKKLIMEGTKQFNNIIYHESGPYIISASTFPSYFQKDEESVIKGHALLDLSIFTDIAKHLHVNKRYVGDEPTSLVTGIYNKIMSEKLPEHGIKCIIISRAELDGKPISASTARTAIHDNNWDVLKELVPESTYEYFISDKAIPVIEKIQAETNVVHY